MSQRRSSRPLAPVAVAIGVAIVVILGAVYWFGIRDDNKSSSNGPLAAKTFNQAGLPFTFQYPGNFAETTGPAGFVWIAGVGPYDILDLKRLANVPTAMGRLRSDNRKALSQRAGLKIISEGSDQRAGIDMVKFVVTSTVNGLPLNSDLYFFNAGGVTWQFECESQAQAVVIDAACAQALSTFTVA